MHCVIKQEERNNMLNVFMIDEEKKKDIYRVKREENRNSALHSYYKTVRREKEEDVTEWIVGHMWHQVRYMTSRVIAMFSHYLSGNKSASLPKTILRGSKSNFDWFRPGSTHERILSDS